jgi:hypothetical protein
MRAANAETIDLTAFGVRGIESPTVASGAAHVKPSSPVNR